MKRMDQESQDLNKNSMVTSEEKKYLANLTIIIKDMIDDFTYRGELIHTTPVTEQGIDMDLITRNFRD